MDTCPLCGYEHPEHHKKCKANWFIIKYNYRNEIHTANAIRHSVSHYKIIDGKHVGVLIHIFDAKKQIT